VPDYPRPTSSSYWVVPGRLLAGAYPGSRDEELSRRNMAVFLDAAFDIFLDLTCEGELPPYQTFLMEGAAQRGQSIHYQRFPIVDKGLPSVETMTAILAAIDSSLVERRKVYLHCFGGIGRTGTVVGCYLAQHGQPGLEAIRRLQELYATSEQFTYFPCAPETDQQVAFVLNWEKTSPPQTSGRPKSHAERSEASPR